MVFMELSDTLKVKLLKPTFNDQGELTIDWRTIDIQEQQERIDFLMLLKELFYDDSSWDHTWESREEGHVLVLEEHSRASSPSWLHDEEGWWSDIVEERRVFPQGFILLPTAWVTIQADPEGPTVQARAILDSGASRTYVSQYTVTRLGAETAEEDRFRVTGANGSFWANGTLWIIIEGGIVQGYKRLVRAGVLNHMGRFASCSLTPSDLGEWELGLADRWPRPEESCIDVLIGQDLLWDIYTGAPRKLERPGQEMQLCIYPTKLGKVVAGVVGDNTVILPEDAAMLLREEPAFHLLHPARRGHGAHPVAHHDKEECLLLHPDGPAIEKVASWHAHFISQEEKEEAKAQEKAHKKREESLPHVTELLDAFMRYEGLGIEPPPIQGEKQLTAEEEHALKSIRDSLVFENGKYQVGLTFAENHPHLDSNLNRATKRYENLEKSFKQQDGLREKYAGAMQEFIDAGDIEEVTTEGTPGRTFYLPHRAVIKMDKATSKVRIVFDGSAKAANGVSLNDCLLKGPQGEQDILRIINNFRWEKVAFSGDVRRMFLCIGVREEDRDCLRFLWRPDENGAVKAFRFVNVTFGLRDSPFLAQEVFKHHARKFAKEFPLAVDILLNKRWVDDLLSSVKTAKTALEVIKTIQDIMAQGGFPVKKWVSSDSSVMDSISEEDKLSLGEALRFQGAEGLFDQDSVDSDKVSALGVAWFVIRDIFRIAGTNQPALPRGTFVTKRLILSRVSSIFDPPGFVSPYTVTGKRLAQRTWENEKKELAILKLKGNELLRRRKGFWDEEVPEDIAQDFRAWLMDLGILREFEIPRCLVIKDKAVNQREIHVFGDASPWACAAVSFCRVQYMDGSVSTLILNAKSKVAPAEDSAECGKPNLPRLELTAAVMAKRIASHAILDHPSTPVFLWGDSSVALQWIKTGVLDKKIWVANRVREILLSSTADQWRHCPGEENPADLGTRGISCQDLATSQPWLFGPAWLPQEEKTWPDRKFTLEEADQVEFGKEVAKIGSPDHHQVLLVTQGLEWKDEALIESEPLSPLAAIRARSGSLDALVSTTILFMFKRKGEEPPKKTLDRERYVLMKHIIDIQRIYYRLEIQSLEAKESLPKGSKIARVDPIIDQDGLLRARGRLPGDAQHPPPVILPGRDHLTRLIIRKVHEDTAHRGAEWTRYFLFRDYWVSKAKEVIKSVLSKCVQCQRLRKVTLQQGAGDLPPWRAEEEPRPFSYVGVDYCGPLMSYGPQEKKGTKRDKNKEDTKLYVVLFTCMQIRAVHLEVVNSQAVEPLNRAVRRFMARRGKPKQFYSDNAKSFKKAAQEIEMLQEFHTAQGVRHNLRSQGIEWKFMPERAPWWGALHERMVGTVKQTLRVTLNGKYGEDEIRTFVVEAEAIVNSRPLARVTANAAEPLPVTPSELLLGFNVTAAPLPLVPTQGKMNNIKRTWARRQHLQQQAWRRFVKDYVQLLRQREKKEVHDALPLQVGDLVLFEGGSGKRTDWPLARVVALHPGRDGHVRMVTLRTKYGETRRPVQAVVALELDEMQELPHPSDTPPLSPASSMSEEQLARYATPPNESVEPGGEQVALAAQDLPTTAVEAAAAVKADAAPASQPGKAVAAGDESDWSEM